MSRISIKSKSTLCLGKVQGTGSSTNIKCASPQSERKVYRACIQRALGYVSDTLAMNVKDMNECKGYGKIEENGTNDGQVDAWCSRGEEIQSACNSQPYK